MENRNPAWWLRRLVRMSVLCIRRRARQTRLDSTGSEVLSGQWFPQLEELIVPENETADFCRGADFHGVNIIAFRRLNQMDISGNVVTESEYLPSLKVRLYREDNPGVPIHTVSLGVVSFFYLPSLQIDDQLYTVKLESSLSKITHEFSQPEMTLLANVSYKHITFQFNPKRKSVDQELGQGSFLVLPLTVLAILAVYNYQKLLPMGQQVFSQVQEAVVKVHKQGGGDAPVNPTYIETDSPQARKKNKSRRT